MFKKLRIFATLVGVLAVAAGCQQYDEIEEQQPTETQTLTAFAPGSGTKIGFTDDLDKGRVFIEWQKYDNISIFNADTEQLVANFYASSVEEDGRAIFTRSNGEPLVSGTNYTAVYPAVESIVTTLDQRNADQSYTESTQNGTNSMGDLSNYIRMKSATFQLGESVAFAHEMAIMTIGFNYPDGTPEKLVYSDRGVDYTVNLSGFSAGGSAVHFMVMPDPEASYRSVTAVVSGTASDLNFNKSAIMPYKAGIRYTWSSSDYTISFDPNGGVDPYPDLGFGQVGEAGVPLLLVPTGFTYTDKVLAGWSLDPSATTPTYTDGGLYVGVEDVTLYAIWYDLADCVVIDGNKITGVKTDKFNQLSSIIIPASYNGTPITSVSLGNGNYSNNTMKSVTVAEGITELSGSWPNAGFANFTALEDVRLPNSLTIIGNYSFMGCSSLEYIPLPENLQSIGTQALQGTGLKQIDIPASLTSLEVGAFDMCLDLQNINVADANTIYSSTDGNLYSKDGTKLIKVAPAKTSFTFGSDVDGIMYSAFSYNKKITEVAIPETVIHFESRIFEDCSELVKVTLPTSMTTIPSFTFIDCQKLKEVVILGELTEIKWNAFRTCVSLTNFTIPESVTTIEDFAFMESGLTEITIPASVNIMEGKVFGRCYSLNAINVKGKTERPATWEENWNWKYDTESGGVYTTNWNVE